MNHPISSMTAFLLFYLLLINLCGFVSMGLDKHRARRQKWRIPEKTLFLFALLGGSPGSVLGMFLFHHKTRHWYFRYGLPAILLVQAAAAGYLLFH